MATKQKTVRPIKVLAWVNTKGNLATVTLYAMTTLYCVAAIVHTLN